MLLSVLPERLALRCMHRGGDGVEVKGKLSPNPEIEEGSVGDDAQELSGEENAPASSSAS